MLILAFARRFLIYFRVCGQFIIHNRLVSAFVIGAFVTPLPSL